MRRWIMHVDMDAFFASVEQHDFPEYKGRPVIVGGLSARGVVATASYEARAYGVHSAMSMAKAKRLCPNGIYLWPRFERYQEVSRQVHEVMEAYSPYIEPISLDEAFLDITALTGRYSGPYALGREFKEKVLAKTGLIISVGLAPNKFLAKLASDWKKPDGLVVIPYGKEAETIAPLPVKRLWGVGKQTEKRLKEAGFYTIGDIAKLTNATALQTICGKWAERLYLMAKGIDERPIEYERTLQSVGNEETYEEDLDDEEVIDGEWHYFAHRVGKRLRRKGLKGHTVTIKIRYNDFSTFTRQKQIDYPTDEEETIYEAVQQLYQKVHRIKPVRLLGVTVSGFDKTLVQESLFSHEEERHQLTETIDQLEHRFGDNIVMRGSLWQRNRLQRRATRRRELQKGETDMKTFTLACGHGSQTVQIPEKQIVDVVEGKEYPSLQDIKQAILDVLDHPTASKPLREIVKAGETVCVVVSDITRAWIRYDLFLPVLLDYLNALGVKDKDITLLVAYGSHRLQTGAENVKEFGQEVVNRVAIKPSSAINKNCNYVHVGETSHGVPIELNEVALKADRLILTGGIVFHLIAGFGGGRKAVMPGISSYEAIQKNHCLCLTEEVGGGCRPEIVSGNITTNRMHDDQMEHALVAKPDFLINVVANAEGKPAAFVGGDLKEAWLKGTQLVEAMYEVPIQKQADCVVASAGGFPMDINLYQGVKTQDNAVKACRDGGVVILLMDLEDIEEPGDFVGWFAHPSVYDHEVALRKAFTVPGFASFLMRTYFEKKHHILVTNKKNLPLDKKFGVEMVDSLDKAMSRAKEILGRNDFSITVMPEASHTLPVVKNK